MIRRTLRRLARLAVVASLFTPAGCAWLTPSHVTDIGQIVACVLSHDTMPVVQIASLCGVEDSQQIVDILAAHRRAMAAETVCK